MQLLPGDGIRVLRAAMLVDALWGAKVVNSLGSGKMLWTYRHHWPGFFRKILKIIT